MLFPIGVFFLSNTVVILLICNLTWSQFVLGRPMLKLELQISVHERFWMSASDQQFLGQFIALPPIIPGNVSPPVNFGFHAPKKWFRCVKIVSIHNLYRACAQQFQTPPLLVITTGRVPHYLWLASRTVSLKQILKTSVSEGSNGRFWPVLCARTSNASLLVLFATRTRFSEFPFRGGLDAKALWPTSTHQLHTKSAAQVSGAQTFSLSYQRNAPLKTSNQLKTRLRLDTCTCLPSQPSPNCGSPSLMADSANATTDTAVPIIKHTHTFRWNETHRVFRADKKEQQTRSPAQQECTFMFRLLLSGFRSFGV